MTGLMTNTGPPVPHLYRRRPPFLFFVCVLAVSFTFDGCISLGRRIHRIPLEPAAVERILMTVAERQASFGDCRGRFTARVEKPGVDIGFHGLFLLEGRGNSRIEIYSPFGTVLHFFRLERHTFIYRNDESLVEGNAFDELAEIRHMWGLTLKPYQIQTLISGSYIDPFFYTIEPMGLTRLDDRIEVKLRGEQADTDELLHLDPSATYVLRHEIKQMRTNRVVIIDYEYEEKENSSRAVSDEECPYPTSVTIRNIHDRVRLSIVFSEVRCSCGTAADEESTFIEEAHDA